MKLKLSLEKKNNTAILNTSSITPDRYRSCFYYQWTTIGYPIETKETRWESNIWSGHYPITALGQILLSNLASFYCGIGLKNQKDAQMFPRSFKTHHMKTKIWRKYNAYHAKTERLKNSLIIYTQNLLNQYERLKYY